MIVQPRADVGVVVGLESADGHPDRHAELRELREVAREEAVDARIREPDGVEHPDVGLGDAHRCVPVARERRDGLRHERVEAARDVGRGETVETSGGVKQHGAPAPRRRDA